MAATALDTLAIARKLKAAGFSDDQAEVALVTKADLKTEIAEAKYDILKWVLSAIGFQTIVIVGAIVTLARGLH